jgi:hypothetical protein
MLPRSTTAAYFRAAWLALLAMLLINGAPVLSQSLSAARTPAAIPCAEHHGAHPPSADAGHEQALLWVKCGYCNLLHSSPATALGALQLRLPRAALAYAQAAVKLAEPSPPIFLGARSRAPPVFR